MRPSTASGAARALVLALVPLAAGACASPPPAEHGLYTGFEAGAGEPSVRTLHALSRVLAHQGRDDQGELVLRKLIDTHPRFLPAYVELAELHLRQDELEEAALALEAGLEVAPADPVLLNDLGMVRVLEGDHASALSRFTEASAASPGDARSRANMALALALMGRRDEALDLYLEVVPPEDAHHNLGVLARAAGDDQAAATHFAKAEQLEKERDRIKRGE